jgi:hypothetical protein
MIFYLTCLYICATTVLHLRTHYDYDTSAGVMTDLRQAFEFMTDTNTCVAALQEAEHYRRKQGSFSSGWLQRWHVTLIHLQVSNSVIVFISSHSRYLATLITELFPLVAQWWAMFDGDTPNLQKLALWIVSQCCSSSGWEHNLSTFALIPTKVHNKLSYKKLHKLVYVNYNIRIRLRQTGTYERDEDPFSKLMKLSLYDDRNSIRDWMENGKSFITKYDFTYLHSRQSYV